MQEMKEITIDKLKLMAYELIEKDTPETEIRKRNITNEFLIEIAEMAERKELINIQITGTQALGKSTLGQKIQYIIIEDCLKQKMDLKLIASDQYEFYRKTLENIQNTCILLDEISALEETSINSTLEAKYLEHFNQVQAQRYIHRIACAPKRIFDNTCKIIINVESKNPERKTTTASVYYRILTPNRDIIQMIGMIEIYVGDILKKEWYERYRTKKFARFDLITKNGIFQMRTLQFAKVILKSYASLKPLCGIFKPPRDVIEGRTSRILDEEKIPVTLFAMEHIKTSINNLITQTVLVKAIEKKIEKEKNEIKKRTLKNELEIANKGLEEDIGRQQNFIEIFNKYQEI